MAKIPGSISITGLLAPNDSLDTYAITDEKYNRGGYRAVSTPTERDNITQDRRSEGMLVKVLSENKFYTLSGGVWVEQVMGGTGGGGGTTVTGVLPISVTNNAVSILEATTTEAGAMSAADKLKLNGIASGAEVNVNADWNAVSGDAQILNKPSTFTPSAHNHSAAEITSGTIATARLGSGTANSTTFLRGDNTWQTVQTNTPTATSSILGGVKLWSDAIQSVAANSVSSTASRTYGIQFNGSNQAVVNVPWTDTDTNTTYTFASGTTNGAFQVTPSGSSAISVSIYGLGSAAYTASTAYAASNHTHDYSTIYQPLDADLTAIAGLASSTGFLKKTGTSWSIETVSAGGVTSVNTRTGDIVLSKSDVSLGNVDNTSDANKPVSTATQIALNAKSDTNHNHTLAGLSEKSYNSLTDKPNVAKEMLISKSTFNSIAEPGIYKNGATAKQITGYRLMSNATDFQITIAGTSYTKDSVFPITLAANAELLINDVTIANTYNIGNVILIIE